MAMSLDGYIADADGSVLWLNDFYAGLDNDFEARLDATGAFIMGRKTFDIAIESYGESSDPRITYVLTRSPMPQRVNVKPFIDIEAMVIEARTALKDSDKQIWMMGGGLALRAMIAANTIDVLEITLIPLMLGNGIPLFPDSYPNEHTLKLIGQKLHPNGAVGLTYALKQSL